jgi:hypothetical protein
MFEVAFINAYYDYVFLYKLSHESASPKPSFIKVSISILGVGFVKLLELQIELLLHYLSQNSC